MSVAMVCRSSSTASFPLEKKEVLLGSLLMPSTPFVAAKEAVVIRNVDDESPPPPPPGEGELIDIWSSIQARKAKQPNVDEPSYVHPLTRRSSSLMSQKSLEICTENLGSETGSDHYYSSEEKDVDMDPIFKQQQAILQQQEVDQEQENDVVVAVAKKEQEAAVNYHCCSSSSSRRSAPSRTFPPPLPSISCRDGPCVQMRPHRKDGRLVVEAVAVPSQNYLHAQRQGGRLLLSFIDTTTPPTPNKNIIINTNNLTPDQEQEPEPERVMDDADLMDLEEDQEEEEEEEEDEEEEVEVVDRGTVVEVKVSTQPQQQSGGGSAAMMKVHRSSIVINKFVSCTSLSKENSIDSSDDDVEHATSTTASGTRRSTACCTTTAAAAAVAASSLSALPADGSRPCSFDNKLLLLTSRRRNSREELLQDMRRCSQLRKPLFIWEPCCIAT